MIICTKCGLDNQLGRVFCTSCGAKLDLSNISNQAISDSNKESWISLHWKKLVVIPIVLIVLLLAGLVMWPKAEAIGANGTSSGSRKIEGQVTALGNLKAGQRFSYAASEEELNGYLQTVLARKAKLSSMSVKLSKGLVVVRTMKAFYEAGSGKSKTQIGVSFEAICVPVGGRLRIVKASAGHLKLVGPLVKVADKVFGAVLASEPKLANLNNIEELTIDEGKLSFIAGKK